MNNCPSFQCYCVDLCIYINCILYCKQWVDALFVLWSDPPVRNLSTQLPCLPIAIETTTKAVDFWSCVISPFLQKPWRWSLCPSPPRDPRRRCSPLPTPRPWGLKRTARPSRSCSCCRRSRTPRGRRDRRRSSGTTPASLSSTGLTSRTRSRSWWSEVPPVWSTWSECVCVSVRVGNWEWRDISWSLGNRS